MAVVFEEVTARMEPSPEQEDAQTVAEGEAHPDSALTPDRFVELKKECERRRLRLFAD